MSKNRPIAKRFDVNDYEANLLAVKSKQCGLTEAAYIRELITGHGPKEAPGKEFYKAMNNINKIGVNINKIAAVACSTGVIDDGWLRKLAESLNRQMLELKEIVLKAESYHNSYYEKLLYKQKMAKKEGKAAPVFGDDLYSGEKEPAAHENGPDSPYGGE